MSEKNEKETTPEYPGSATLEMVDDIIKNPGKFGFEWSAWDASSRQDKDGKDFPAGLTVLRKDCSCLPKAKDAKLFGKYFGEHKLLEGYNGTSGRVKAQEIGRSELLEHWNEQRAAKVSEYHLRREVVIRHLLEQRKPGSGGGTRKHWIVNGVVYLSEADAIAASKVAPKIYLDMAGKEHKTPLEVKQANYAILRASGVSEEIAKNMIAAMPEA